MLFFFWLGSKKQALTAMVGACLLAVKREDLQPDYFVFCPISIQPKKPRLVRWIMDWGWILRPCGQGNQLMGEGVVDLFQ